MKSVNLEVTFPLPQAVLEMGPLFFVVNCTPVTSLCNDHRIKVGFEHFYNPMVDCLNFLMSIEHKICGGPKAVSGPASVCSSAPCYRLLGLRDLNPSPWYRHSCLRELDLCL